MPIVEDILAGIGGATRGGMEAYSWEKEHQQKERAITSREEMTKLKEEIRLMIADLNEGGRNTRHETPSGNTLVTVEGANARHETPSGNTILTEGGRNARHATDDATRRFVHTTPSGNTINLEAGRDRRWLEPSGNAALGAETTRRGQDLNFTLGNTRDATARRGQDVSADTTRRGQDAATERARIRGAGSTSPYSGLFDVPATGGTTKGTIPVTPRQATPAGGGTGSAPVSPPASTEAAPAAPDAAAQRRTELETRAASTLQQYRAETNPQKKAALRAELLRLRAQAAELGGGR